MDQKFRERIYDTILMCPTLHLRLFRLNSFLLFVSQDMPEWMTEAGVPELLAGDEKGMIACSDTEIGDDGAIALAKIIEANPEKIMSVFASGCGIGAEGIKALCKALGTCEEVMMVDVGNNPIGPEGGEALGELAGSGSICNLVCGSCSLGDEGISSLCKGIEAGAPETLSRLNIDSNGMGSDGLAALASMLADNKSIGALVIGGNSLEGEGLERFAASYEISETLEMVSLAGGSLGDEGLAAIVSALAYNKSVYELDLSDCGIGSEGAGFIAGAFSENTSLADVNLSGNPIGDDGATALVDLIGANTKIEVLGLSGCGIGPEGGAALAAACKASETLSDMNLADNDVGDEVMAMLE